LEHETKFGTFDLAMLTANFVAEIAFEKQKSLCLNTTEVDNLWLC